MSRHTSLRVGGPAEIFAAPESVEDLQSLISWAREIGVPYMVIGRGTNLLVKDSGIRGIVVVLTKCLKTIEQTNTDTGGVLVAAMAGTNLKTLCSYALKRGLKGMNFSLGIPGTVGGGIIMNAGTSHGSMEHVLKSIDVLLPTGHTCRIEGKSLDFGYRKLSWNPKLTDGHMEQTIVLNGRFCFYPSDPEKLNKAAREIIRERHRKQPIGWPSAGCFFKNPASGPTAGQLIEMAGLKGKSVGGAEISSKHANFFLNRCKASAADFLALIDLTEEVVFKTFNVHLEREVKVVGA
ncbi:MAG: UDP-N-acetylmuramate dehydrogenase [Desulfobacterales bacterium]